ncbi:MAG: hypothetical protein ACFB6R_02630 [Alphaproteobacteria bacterium]
MLVTSHAAAPPHRPGWGRAIVAGLITVLALFAALDPAKAETRIGGTITIKGPTEDVRAIGGVVQVNGPIAGGVAAAGGTVTVTGPVSGDVGLAAGEVTVNARVLQDLKIAGGAVTVMPGSRIMGDVNIASADITLDGRLTGDAELAGASVYVSADIGGNTEISAASVTIAPNAVFRGNLTIEAPEEPDLPEGVVIKGTYTYAFDPSGGLFSIPSVSIQLDALDPVEAGALIGFILILLLLLIYAFPTFNNRVLRTLSNRPAGSLATGLVLSVLMPVVAALLCMTIIGLVIGIPALLVYPVILVLGLVYGLVGLNQWLLSRFVAKPGVLLSLVGLVGTIVLVALAMSVPVIGTLVAVVLLLVGTGAVGSVMLYGERACVPDPNPPRESWGR